MIVALWLLGCSLVGGVVDGEVTQADLEAICQAASDYDGAKVHPGRRLEVVAERLDSQGLKAALRAWKLIMAAPPKLRMAAYRELLDQAGAPEFQCEPLERALSQR